MTNWVTKQDMIDAFGEREILQLTDKVVPRANVINDTVLNAAIIEAQGVISPILRRRYPTWPTPIIPDGVKSKARHVARYYLYDPNVTELVRKNYEDALAWLKDAVFTNEELGITPETGDTGATAAAADAVGISRTSKYGASFSDQYDPCTP